MPRRLLAGVGALTLALLATFVPDIDGVHAATAHCTGWSSTTRPPSTIRVYRSGLHRTVAVDFRQYVRVVVANEWGPTHPRASLRAGAIAIKQYGWYFAMHWRGGRDWAGRCFDVVDTTHDQVYAPSKTIYPTQDDAVRATWNLTLRKGTSFFMTGYRAGDGICGDQQDGWHLMQRNASACVMERGESMEQILRRYYGSSVSVVDPGLNDVTGDGYGDGAAVVTDAVTGQETAALATSDPRTAVQLASVSQPVVLATVSAGSLLDQATTDLNRDGRRDLVQLIATANGGAQLKVMLGSSTGFRPGVAWWSGIVQGSNLRGATVRVVTGDFDADGLGDVGLLRVIPAPPPNSLLSAQSALSTLFLLRSTGSGLHGPAVQWQQSIDLSAAKALAGDVTGDGRADLVLLRPTSANGTAIQVAPSTNTRGLSHLRDFLTLATPLANLKAVVADVDRNGRDDLALAVRQGADQLALEVGISTGTSFRAAWWFRTASAYSWSSSKVATADVDRDGRADLLAFRDGGSLGGSVVDLFHSTGSSFALSRWRTLPEAWSQLAPV